MLHHLYIFKTIALENLRFLVFKPIRPQLNQYFTHYIIWCVLILWLAGIGRYWDNPLATTFQKLGIGSILYAIIFSLFLWLIGLPLKPRNWDYKNVFVFMGFTALPALLYAIPVELYFSMPVATKMNMWFLIVVATLRVCYLVNFLKKSAGFENGKVILLCFLPLSLIMMALTILNVEHATFSIMGGFLKPTPNDTSYIVIAMLGFISLFLAPILLICYLYLVFTKPKQ